MIILGAGSSGFAAAIKASELGKTFVMVENGTIGGTCVNIGCVPSENLCILVLLQVGKETRYPRRVY